LLSLRERLRWREFGGHKAQLNSSALSRRPTPLFRESDLEALREGMSIKAATRRVIAANGGVPAPLRAGPIRRSR